MAKTRFNDPDALRLRIRSIPWDKVDGELFVEVLLEGLGLKNAAELSRELGIAPAVVSRIRSCTNPIPDHMLIGLHEAYNLDIRSLKDLILLCAKVNGDSDNVIVELAKHEVFAARNQRTDQAARR
jgi:hypothetical protein